MLGHKLPVFPTHLGGASYRIGVLAMSVFAVDMESMQLRNFSRLRILAVNNNEIQTGNLILESLPALEELYAPNYNSNEFPNLSDAPALEIVQLHFNHFNEIPTFALKNLLQLRKFAFLGCNVAYLPDMSHLMKLKELFISNNKLVAIPDLYHLRLTSIK